MGIEAVQEEIISLTQKIGEEKIESAAKKANEIKNETLKIITEEDEKAKKETEYLIEQLKKLLDAQVKFEIRKIELKSKKELLTKIFEKAKEKINSFDDKTQERLTMILLDEANKEIEVRLVICNKKTSKWIPKNFDIQIEEMNGGLITETKDGTLRVDNSYETILEKVRKDALKKIVKDII